MKTERITRFEKDLKYKRYDINNSLLYEHINTWDIYNSNIIMDPGNIFLMEIIDDNSGYCKISNPIVGIFYDYDCYDQAVVIRWIPYHRNKDYNLISEGMLMDTNSIESFCFGDNSILLYDVWDILPKWKQLKKSYNKTWSYHKTREHIIDSLLK